MTAGDTAGMIDDFISIAELVMRFGEVQRATFHADGATRETDTTHTVMLALCALRANAELGLDPGRLLTMALVHDLVEAYAGDTNTLVALGPDDAEAKAAREREALERIGSVAPWLASPILLYDAQDTPEARAIRYLDKIMPKLTHTLNGGATVRGAGLSLAQLVTQHRKQGKLLAERYADFPAIGEWFDEAADRSEDALTR